MFEIVDNEVSGPIIKVIGVGGAGGNAINHMIDEGVQGVEFIAVNTDAQVLARNRAPSQIQLGTSGLGGGTGTGAAPVIAEVARSLGILTVAVVTKPFTFEGSKRMKIAEGGLEALGEDVTQEDAFKAADDVLNNAVAGIAEIINNPGLVNVDFQDVRTVMSEQG